MFVLPKLKHSHKVIIVFTLVAIAFVLILNYLVSLSFKNKESLDKNDDVNVYIKDILDQEPKVEATQPVEQHVDVPPAEE